METKMKIQKIKEFGFSIWKEARVWKSGRKLHRDGDKPAIEFLDGGVEYWMNGKLFRKGDKPAIIRANGDQYYYKNGKIHRDGDKPAIIRAEGTVLYYKKGRIHRDGDKPAMTAVDGYMSFYKNGNLHRDGDKPAVVLPQGGMSFNKKGKLHRDGDKPALVNYQFCLDSTIYAEAWYQDGKQWREGGEPSAILANGTKQWTNISGEKIKQANPDGSQWEKTNGKWVQVLAANTNYKPELPLGKVETWTDGYDKVEVLESDAEEKKRLLANGWQLSADVLYLQGKGNNVIKVTHATVVNVSLTKTGFDISVA